MKPWIGISLVLAVAGCVAYFLIYRGPVDATERMAKIGTDSFGDAVHAVSDALGLKPREIEENRVIFEGTEQVSELTTAKQTFTQTYYWEHEWAGSTKKLKVEGTFVAKAGFVLSSPLELQFSNDTQSMTALLPDPTVLSNEQVGIKILEDESGYWNHLTTADRQFVHEELKRRADVAAQESNLLLEADRAFVEQMQSAVDSTTRQRTPIDVQRITPQG